MEDILISAAIVWLGFVLFLVYRLWKNEWPDD